MAVGSVLFFGILHEQATILLCFYEYGDHRDLRVLTHSFPTRRSSDLEPREAAEYLVRGLERHVQEPVDRQHQEDDVERRHQPAVTTLYIVFQIGRAHGSTPVTKSQLVCRLLLEKKNKLEYMS